jgi:two-component system phosphate regulon response regulator OmpR
LARYLFRKVSRHHGRRRHDRSRNHERLAFDVVILDVMMPGENGLDRPRPRELQHSDLHAHGQGRAEERIQGLEIGVEDYVAKPFEPRELLLRLQNILKRRQGPSGPRDEISMGDYTFQVARGELKRGEESIKLTERERELLRQFAQRPGTPIARHELAADESSGTERAVDVQINRLRRKIESDPANPVYLQTVRGKGYILYTD